MPILVDGVYANNCGSAVKAEGDFPDGLTLKNINAVDCIQTLDLRDRPSIISSIGLPDTTPPEILLEALKLLSSLQGESPEKKAQELKTSRLGSFINLSADATTTISNLISISTSPTAAQVIAAVAAMVV